MHPIIYDVAVSLDGFIAGPAGDVSQFAYDGPVVEDYQARMASYSTALMGRETYEFGYQFGLTPGQTPYPHMQCVVVSSTLTLPEEAEVLVERTAQKERILSLCDAAPGPVYLCGGGQFAGWMLSQGLITEVRLKRAPILLGAGVPLFGGTAQTGALKRVSTTPYDNGYLLETFTLA
ncbi:MAG: dihydrofolate reductase family protein [Maritimibacter sp.]